MAKNSVVSRIKITKTGELIRRKMGIGHCRAKKSNRQLARKGNVSVHHADLKVFRKSYGMVK
ncbi:MAG: hypothetical protein AAB885_03745 [Patescibacteria group bacterium]